MSAAKDNDQEMSMEEILASIRKYVTEETPETQKMAPSSMNTAKEQAPKKEEEPFSLTQELRQSNPFATVAKSSSFTPPSSIPTPPVDVAARQPLPSTPIVKENTAFDRGSLKPQEESAFSPAQEKQTAAFTIPKEAPFAPQEISAPQDNASMTSQLMSHAAQEAASSALSKLASLSKPIAPAPSSTTPSPQTLDELFKELAKPMIAAWLDKNLPGLVESLVEKEIKRLSQNLSV